MSNSKCINILIKRFYLTAKSNQDRFDENRKAETITAVMLSFLLTSTTTKASLYKVQRLTIIALSSIVPPGKLGKVLCPLGIKYLFQLTSFIIYSSTLSYIKRYSGPK